MTHAARGGKSVVDEGEVVKTLRSRNSAGNRGEGVGDVVDRGARPFGVVVRAEGA